MPIDRQLLTAWHYQADTWNSFRTGACPNISLRSTICDSTIHVLPLGTVIAF